MATEEACKKAENENQHNESTRPHVHVWRKRLLKLVVIFELTKKMMEKSGSFDFAKCWFGGSWQN